MVDMETGLRGFLVTGHDEYLDPFYNGRERFEEVMEAEQELSNDNPAAVATLQAIHDLQQEWLHGYAEPAIELRHEVEQGAQAQERFAQISARTIGKEKFDGIRAILGGINSKFEDADHMEGQFLMKAITLDLVNMETGQRGFLVTGEDASLAPYTQGEIALAADVEKLNNINHIAIGVTDSEVASILVAVSGWQEAAAQPEIDARIEVRSFPKDMGDVIAMVNSGLGKESMDVIRADLGAFFDAEVALNIVRAAEVSAQANSARTMGIGIAAASIAIMMVIGFLIARSITTPIVRIGKSMANMAGVALPDLVNVSRAVAGGDLTIKSKVMIERVDIDSKDEVGEMAESFNVMIDQMELMGRSTNEMVDNLSGLVGQVSNTAGGVAEASESLSSAAEEAGNATQGISFPSQELAKGAQTQTESVDQTNAAMEQLSTAIEQIAKGS